MTTYGVELPQPIDCGPEHGDLVVVWGGVDFTLRWQDTAGDLHVIEIVSHAATLLPFNVAAELKAHEHRVRGRRGVN